MIIDVKMYSVICDNCGIDVNADAEYSAWSYELFARDSAKEANWIEEGGAELGKPMERKILTLKIKNNDKRKRITIRMQCRVQWALFSSLQYSIPIAIKR